MYSTVDCHGAVFTGTYKVLQKPIRRPMIENPKMSIEFDKWFMKDMLH